MVVLCHNGIHKVVHWLKRLGYKYIYKKALSSYYLRGLPRRRVDGDDGHLRKRGEDGVVPK